MLEELTLDILANVDESKSILLDELVVGLLLLPEDDVELEWMLLDELDGVMLDDNKLLFVDSVAIWLEDDFGEVAGICKLELDRNKVEDGEAVELLLVLLLLVFK